MTPAIVAMRRQLMLFFVAIQFLTRLPTPVQSPFDPASLAQSARYFPTVGVLVGIINVSVWWLSTHWFPDAVSIGIMLAMSLLVTGAFHEDGFADTCDGMGGGGTVDRILAIMKDSRVGAYGAIGIFMMLGLKWTTLVSIPGTVFPLLVVSAHMFSRWCATALIWRLRYVRIDESAKSKPVADSLSGRDWILSGALGVVVISACAFAAQFTFSVSEARAISAATVAASISAVVLANYFRQRIGGYTGDCLGAVQQVTELTFLLAGLATLSSASRIG
jgi:adenosylcobinamide-GDP ribazoletransferase